MNPKNEMIPGLRRPTAQEQARITEIWGSELRRRYSPNAGKLIRYVGVFLICTGVVNLVRGAGGVTGMILLLALAAVCLGFSSIGRKSAKQHGARLAALERGDYMVAPAYSTKIDSTFSGNSPRGFAYVSLPGGEPVQGFFEIPYVCAEPLLRQRMHTVPLLLIQIPGSPDILAIPVE